MGTDVKTAKRAAPFCMALVLVACGGRAPAPAPGTSQGTPPDIRGLRVLVLPVQQVTGVVGDLDAEIAFGLRDRTRDVTWVLAPEIEDILARSPAVNTRTRGLPVGQFLGAEVRRVGDPLFGLLRRMAALVDADAVLLPVRAVAVVEAGADPKITLAVTLIEARTGRVRWFGVVEGEAFPAGDPRGLATSVNALARTLLWYMGD